MKRVPVLRTAMSAGLSVLVLASACSGPIQPAHSTATTSAPAVEAEPEAAGEICPAAMAFIIGAAGDDQHEYLDTVQAFIDGKNRSTPTPATVAAYSAADLGLLGEIRHSNAISSEVTRQHFYDPDRYAAGNGLDADPAYGIDQAMLLFYAGHGDPLGFHVINGDIASPDSMLLGNCSADGQLRYYWQCSCQVFAHGPNTANTGPKYCGSGAELVEVCYDNPGGWNGSVDSSAMRNVFDRWGLALDPSLRMACGASTDVPCNPLVTQAMWENLKKKGYDVSDSFINALWRTGSVALCITLGGSDVITTPLVTDSNFIADANTAGDSHYHVEYAQSFEQPYASVRPAVPPPAIPPQLPVLFMRADASAEVVTGEESLQLEEELSEQEYIDQARGYLAEYYPELVEQTADPVAVHLRLASTPVDPGERAVGAPMQIAQKNVIVSFRRQLDLAGILGDYGVDPLDEIPERIDVLGPGGTIEIQLNNDGSLRRANKSWLELTGVGEFYPTIDYGQAQEVARDSLGDDSQAYEVGSWTWGYLENVDRPGEYEIMPYYQFWFVPSQGIPSSEFPPRPVLVPAIERT